MNISSKRNLFLLLLVAGILGMVATVYFLFMKPADTGVPVPSDGQIQGALPPSAPIPAIPLATSTAPAPAPDSAAELERKAREALYRRARDIAARSATYSSADRFDGLSQVFIDVTPELRTTIEAEQGRLIQQTGATDFVQTTRALSARLSQDIEVRSAASAQVQVDAQQVVEQNGSSTVRLRRAVIDLRKQGEGWIATSITWNDLAP